MQDNSCYEDGTCHQTLVHAHMAVSISAHEPVSPLRPMNRCNISALVADLAQLLCKGCTAVAAKVHLTQQPQHVPAAEASHFHVLQYLLNFN